MDTIETTHAALGKITWYVIGENESGDHILATRGLGMRKPFYDPSLRQEHSYIRIDRSNRKERLVETEPRRSRVISKDIDSTRWQDINAYGSNQWAVSDLRQYLNGEFLDGLPEDFNARIVPQRHDLVLGRTRFRDKSQIGVISPTYTTSTGVEVYDVYDKSMTRITHSILTDSIFLPRVSTMNREFLVDPVVEIPPSGYNCWTMDPYVISLDTPYMVHIFAVDYDTLHRPQAYVNSANAAYPLDVCPICVIRASAREGE